MPRRSVLRVLLVALIYLCILIVTAEIDNVPTATCTEGESGGQVILSGITQYWCGNWLLLFAYNHPAGDSPSDHPSGIRSAPLSPTTSSAHFFLEDLGYDDVSYVERVGFYCSTTAHTRVPVSYEL